MTIGKTLLLTSLAVLGLNARAIDLMRNPDRCQVDRLRQDTYLAQVLDRGDARSVMCWHQEVKLLTAASVLTKLIRNRTATFVDGTGTLDLSIAALTGYKLDSMVGFWAGGRVFLALIVARPEAGGLDLVSQIYEISPNHFFAGE